MAVDFDLHFLYLDPVLSADWLFEAGQRYWDRFHPLIVPSLDLIDLAPARRRLAITTLTRRDLAPKTLAEVKKRFPRAYHDPLVYDVVADLKLTLDGRADLRQRFGIPEPPTPAPTRRAR